MSDSDVIKEFLVALGFKVDDAKLKKFSKGIDQATKFVGGLATGVEAMAVAVEAAVTKVSSKFEDLYYAGQRMYDSVGNIRSYAFEIGQMGGSVDGAMQALENMGEFFRSNPGAERFLQGLGVETRTANGQLRGMTEIMGDLSTKLKAMPYYRAKVIANVLGIDPRTLQAMLRDTGKASDRFRAMSRRMGVDQDAAAKASHEFMNDLREFLAFLTLAADRIILKVQPMAEQFLNWLIALDEKTNGWSTTLIGLVAVLGPLLLLLDPIVAGVAALAAGIVALILDFEDWKRGSASFINWDAWADEIDAALKACGELGTAFGELIDALKPLGKWFVDVMGPGMSDVVHLFLDRTTAKIRSLADAIRVVADILQGDWKKAWQDARQWAVDDLQGRTGVPPSGPGPSRAAHDAAVANRAAPRSSSSAAQVGQAATSVAQQIGDFFRRNGFSAQTISGITAGAYAESGLNPGAVNPTSGAFGIGQWLGQRKSELFRRYGPNPNLAQQLEFMLWEMTHSEAGAGAAIQRQSTAAGALRAYIERFMRPGPGTAGDLARGGDYLRSQMGQMALGGARGAGGEVSLSQKTDIHVHGVTDPAAAGREAAGHQARVNDAIVRQLRTTAT